MSSFPGSPRLLKGGIVLLESGFASGAKDYRAAVPPDALTRSFNGQMLSESIKLI